LKYRRNCWKKLQPGALKCEQKAPNIQNLGIAM